MEREHYLDASSSKMAVMIRMYQGNIIGLFPAWTSEVLIVAHQLVEGKSWEKVES